MKRLIVASSNLGKAREIRDALKELPGWTIEPLPRNLPEIEETGRDFIENAALKAVHYSRMVEGLTLADDSGLGVAALGGRPGIHSARYAATAEARNLRLLSELAASGSEDRSAAFYCALAAARGGTLLWTVQTELRGRIAMQPCGAEGFGYDPIFYVPDAGKTLAELSVEAKNRISARGLALVQLRQVLSRPEMLL